MTSSNTFSRHHLLLCLLCGLGVAPLTHSVEPIASSSLTQSKVNAAFLADVRTQVSQQLQLSPSEVDALTSKLSSMSFNQVDGLVSGAASQLQQLVNAPVAGSNASSGLQGSLSQQGISTQTSGSNRERTFSEMQDMRGGFTQGRTGQVSAKPSCEACATGGTGTINDKDPSGDENAKVVKLSAGGRAYIYPDGSFIIQDKDGKQEVYDSKHNDRRDDPRWTANKMPVPDEEGGTRSGSITRDEWRGIIAMLGSKGAPEPQPSSGAGGMVLGNTTTAGTPLETATRRVVDVVQLQRILRVAAEKFGPRLR